MIGQIRAEFRKLFTVRSTYFLLLLSLALLGLIGIYTEGYLEGPVTVLSGSSSTFLAASIMRHASIIGIFGALISLLIMTHEYRYNTINYSLTSSNSRSKFLAAKIITVVLFVLVYSVIFGILGLVFMVFGLHMQDLIVPSQNINVLTYFAKLVCFTEGYALAALLFATLLRNQVAALVVFFVEPSTFEGLMGLLLKHNQEYLPFTSLEQVVVPPAQKIASWQFSPAKGALMFLCYMVVGWAVAWYLFLKRDAN